MTEAGILQLVVPFGVLLLAVVGLNWAVVRWENTRMERTIAELRADIHRQHRELLVILQAHTHENDGAATFHQLTSTGD